VAVRYPWVQALIAMGLAVLWVRWVPSPSEPKRLPSGGEGDAKAWVRFWAPAQTWGGIWGIALVHAAVTGAVVLVAVVRKWSPVTDPGLALVNALCYLGAAEALLRANFSGASVAPAAKVWAAWRVMQDQASVRVVETARRHIQQYAARLMQDDMQLVQEAQHLVDYYYGDADEGIGTQTNLDENSAILLATPGERVEGPAAERARDKLRHLVDRLAGDGYYTTEGRHRRWQGLWRTLTGSPPAPEGFWDRVLRKRYERA